MKPTISILDYEAAERELLLARARRIWRAHALIEQVVENVEAVNPMARLVFAKSPPKLDFGPDLLGRRVLVIDDGRRSPTVRCRSAPRSLPRATSAQPGSSTHGRTPSAR